AARPSPCSDESLATVPVARRASRALGTAIAGATLLPIALCAQATTTPGQPLRVSGTLRSAESREVVRHARVVADRAVSVESNEEGVYFLTLAAGRHRLEVRALGFAPLDTTVDLRASQTLDLLLQRAQVTLATVSVTATSEQADIDPRSPDMSIARLDVQTLRQVPAALGEVDPIRSLTLLPGVSSSSDFTTAINVRGGGADQNLILLDEATIYNPAHILGFLSVFNSDAVDDATLYKGAIPPRFGGRLSSVVDLRQREGNANDFAGTATLGLLASRLALEGPLAGDGSWLVAARRSYADLFARASSDPDIASSVAYFYDLNAKATKPLGSHGTLVASGFLGRDRFAVGDQFSAGWGNKSGTLRWNEIVRERLYSKVTLAASDYDYRLGFPIGRDSARWTARVKSLDLKIDESWHLEPGHRLEFGVQGTLHGFSPGKVSPLGNSNISRKQVADRSAMAGALYLGEEREFGERWALRYGARLSGFVRTGTATVFRYAND
ncbi:MAG TPA: TonB-dependent receptor, partial [Gemmatimonadaceae bacterium]|nr:TonB-dependent receptor [Gemmatimonadaceae bacterium]